MPSVEGFSKSWGKSGDGNYELVLTLRPGTGPDIKVQFNGKGSVNLELAPGRHDWATGISGLSLTFTLSPGKFRSIILRPIDSHASRTSPKCRLKLTPVFAATDDDLASAAEAVELAGRGVGACCDSLSLAELDRLAERGYCDPEFALGPDSVPVNHSKSVSWARPAAIAELGEHASLFVDDVSPCDIKQGHVGDCWLLASIAAASEHPCLIYRLFVPVQIDGEAASTAAATVVRSSATCPVIAKHSVFEVFLYRMGIPVRVRVDDRFAINRRTGRSFFARCNGPELWMLVLEKAFAKMLGPGFRAISGGHERDALQDLTGCPSGSEHFDNWDAAKLWRKVTRLLDEGHLLTVSSNRTVRHGIRTGHAYSILRAQQLSSGTQLVQVRNPWGSGEWTGPWSDKSRLWTPEAEAELGMTHEERDRCDGAFWMPVEDLSARFSCLDFCDTRTCVGVGRVKAVVRAPFGTASITDSLTAPVVQVTLPGHREQRIWIGVHQAHFRGGYGVPYMNTGITVFEKDGDHRPIARLHPGHRRDCWLRIDACSAHRLTVVVTVRGTSLDAYRARMDPTAAEREAGEESGADDSVERDRVELFSGSSEQPSHALLTALDTVFWMLDVDMDSALDRQEIDTFFSALPRRLRSSKEQPWSDVTLSGYDRVNGTFLSRHGFKALFLDVARGLLFAATASHGASTASHGAATASHGAATASHGAATASHGASTASHVASTASHDATSNALEILQEYGFTASLSQVYSRPVVVQVLTQHTDARLRLGYADASVGRSCRRARARNPIAASSLTTHRVPQQKPSFWLAEAALPLDDKASAGAQAGKDDAGQEPSDTAAASSGAGGGADASVATIGDAAGSETMGRSSLFPAVFPDGFCPLADTEPSSGDIICSGTPVRVRRTVVEPLYGWGEDNRLCHGQVGLVSKVIDAGKKYRSAVCQVVFPLEPDTIIALSDVQVARFLEPGDFVRIKDGVVTPAKGWATAKRDSSFRVVSLHYASNVATLRGPGAERWKVDVADLEWEGEDLDTGALAEGDLVRLADETVTPRSQHSGGVAWGEMGAVVRVDEAGSVSVAFPSNPDWRGHVTDVETVSVWRPGDTALVMRSIGTASPGDSCVYSRRLGKGKVSLLLADGTRETTSYSTIVKSADITMQATCAEERPKMGGTRVLLIDDSLSSAAGLCPRAVGIVTSYWPRKDGQGWMSRVNFPGATAIECSSMQLRRAPAGFVAGDSVVLTPTLILPRYAYGKSDSWCASHMPDHGAIGTVLEQIVLHSKRQDRAGYEVQWPGDRRLRLSHNEVASSQVAAVSPGAATG